MRLKLCLLLALLPALLFGQIWEKLLAPGITYRMEVDSATPRVIHAVRFGVASSNVKAVADIGRPTLLAEDPLKGRKTVSEAVAQAGALGGINADFFPFSGDPLGLMIRNGELLSAPYPGRSVFAWGTGGATFGKAEWTATFEPAGGSTVAIDGLNEQCGVNRMVVNAPIAGVATANSKTTAVFAIVKVTSGAWTPRGKIEGEFQVLYEVPSLPVQAENMILVATGTKAAALKALVPGQKVTVNLNVTGLDWTKYENAVGGGPDLVREFADISGKYPKVMVDGEAQGFAKAAFVEKRHPRSAVGRTKEGDLWFVVVDGRQKMSVGASLVELATIMRRLGCVEAINLDGGGSSCLNLFGLALNRPSDGKERAVADMILFNGRAPAPEPVQLALSFPEKVVLGDEVTLVVRNDKGEAVPNTEVLWSATGDAWIDQGGMLHCLGAGSVTVRAMVKGHLLECVLPIEEKPAPPTSGG
jgi:hypothetical protein